MCHFFSAKLPSKSILRYYTAWSLTMKTIYILILLILSAQLPASVNWESFDLIVLNKDKKNQSHVIVVKTLNKFYTNDRLLKREKYGDELFLSYSLCPYDYDEVGELIYQESMCDQLLDGAYLSARNLSTLGQSEIVKGASKEIGEFLVYLYFTGGIGSIVKQMIKKSAKKHIKNNIKKKIVTEVSLGAVGIGETTAAHLLSLYLDPLSAEKNYKKSEEYSFLNANYHRSMREEAMIPSQTVSDIFCFFDKVIESFSFVSKLGNWKEVTCKDGETCMKIESHAGAKYNKLLENSSNMGSMILEMGGSPM